MRGSDIYARIAALSGRAREAETVAAAKGGGIPAFLRDFVTVERTIVVSMPDGGEVTHRGAFECSPDYFGIGESRSDYLRTPLTPQSILEIAAAEGWTLPTATMVDEIFAQADVHLEPRTMTPVVASSSWREHNAMIEVERAGRGGLITGQGKDVVDDATIAPGRLGIYGWHRPNGIPIQQLNTTDHDAEYLDYSQLWRIIRRRVLVDGAPRDLLDVLADPVLYRLFARTRIARPPYGGGARPPFSSSSSTSASDGAWRMAGAFSIVTLAIAGLKFLKDRFRW